MRRGAAVCGVMAGLAGCGPAAREAAPWPEPEAELFFLLRSAGSRPPEVWGPFGTAAADPAQVVELELEGEAELTAWVFDPETLAALSPRIDRRAWSETRLMVGDAECADGALDDDGRLRVDVERGRPRRFLWEPSGWRPISSTLTETEPLHLRLAYDEALPCSDRGWTVSAFTTEKVVLPEGIVLAGAPRYRSVEGDAYEFFNWIALAYLDADRILAGSPHHLLLLERGRDFDDSRLSSPAPPLPASPDHEIVLTALHRDPTYQTRGRTRVLATYRTLRHEVSRPRARGALREFIVGPNGIEGSMTSTLTAHGLNRLAVDEAGYIVAAGEDGFVLVGHTERGILGSHHATPGGVTADAVHATTDPRHRFVVVWDSGHVHGLSPTELERGLEPLGPDLTVVTSASSAVWARRAPSPEIWLSTFALGLRWKGELGWREATLPIPSSAQTCGGTTRRCGQARLEQPLGSMTPLADGRLLLGPARCSVLLLLSPDLSCVESLVFPGDTPGRLSASPYALTTRWEESLALAGNGGELVLVTPRSAD